MKGGKVANSHGIHHEWKGIEILGKLFSTSHAFIGYTPSSNQPLFYASVPFFLASLLLPLNDLCTSIELLLVLFDLVTTNTRLVC